MYHLTKQLDQDEVHALSVVNGDIVDKVSIRLLQYLSGCGLIILRNNMDNSELTAKGKKSLNNYGPSSQAWLQRFCQDEYRVDEIPRGFPQLPESDTPMIGYIIGFTVLMFFFIGVAIALGL